MSARTPRARTLGARTLGALALGCGAAAAGVTLLAVSAWLLSRAAEHPPVLYLMVAIVAVRACGLARGVLRYLERLVTHDVALRRQQSLRLEAYRALAATTWIGRRSGDLLSRLVNDVGVVTDGFVRAVVPLVTAGVVVLGAGVALTVLEPAAGLVVLAAGLVGSVLVPLATGRLSVASDRSLAVLRGELASVVTDLGHVAPDVLAYGAGRLVADRAARAETALRRAEQRTALVAGLAAALQLLTTGGATLAALAIGAQAVAAGRMPAVDLAVLALTPLALHELVGGVPPALQAAVRSRAAAERVTAVLEAPPVGSGDVTSDPAGRDDAARIDLRAVTLAWPGGPDVVSGLDLLVRAGERVALVGPSGSGKTTVAAAVLGLLRPRVGSADVRGRIGYLAQDAHLFDTTVAANVRLGLPEAGRDEVAAALAKVRLDLSGDRLVGEHGERVSGGEARRIALARLQVGDDDVVLLDEPTEHLDQPTANTLMDDLFDLTTSQALLVITHDPAVAARCDRVVTLAPPVGPVGVRTAEPSPVAG